MPLLIPCWGEDGPDAAVFVVCAEENNVDAVDGAAPEVTERELRADPGNCFAARGVLRLLMGNDPNADCNSQYAADDNKPEPSVRRCNTARC